MFGLKNTKINFDNWGKRKARNERIIYRSREQKVPLDSEIVEKYGLNQGQNLLLPAKILLDVMEIQHY